MPLLKDDPSSSNSTVNINNPPVGDDKQAAAPLPRSPDLNDASKQPIVYLDLLRTKEIGPYVIVSFQEYLFVVNQSNSFSNHSFHL